MSPHFCPQESVQERQLWEDFRKQLAWNETELDWNEVLETKSYELLSRKRTLKALKVKTNTNYSNASLIPGIRARRGFMSGDSATRYFIKSVAISRCTKR